MWPEVPFAGKICLLGRRLRIRKAGISQCTNGTVGTGSVTIVTTPSRNSLSNWYICSYYEILASQAVFRG